MSTLGWMDTAVIFFSKGEDGRSSEFSTELTSTPNKESFDNDNIPETEPGKW